MYVNVQNLLAGLSLWYFQFTSIDTHPRKETTTRSAPSQGFTSLVPDTHIALNITNGNLGTTSEKPRLCI